MILLIIRIQELLFSFVIPLLFLYGSPVLLLLLLIIRIQELLFSLSLLPRSHSQAAQQNKQQQSLCMYSKQIIINPSSP